MTRRARMLSVLGFLIAGGIGIIASTQTWITVLRNDTDEPLLVPGADALALLAPLSLAVLALGAALSIAGTALRYLFAVLGLAGGITLIVGTLPLAVNPPLSAVSAALTEATGLSGEKTLAAMVTSLQPSGWVFAALAAWVLLIVTCLFVLATAHRWRAGGRRYQQQSAPQHHDAGPLDPIDSWDELSHGSDPTGPSR